MVRSRYPSSHQYGGEHNVDDMDAKVHQYNQEGGFLWTTIKWLFYIILFIVILFGLLFYFIVNMFRDSFLVRYPCMLAGSSIFALVTGLLEIVVLFLPPFLWLIPTFKVLDTYAFVCDLLDPETGFMDMLIGILSLFPAVGSLGKFVKFYRKVFM